MSVDVKEPESPARPPRARWPWFLLGGLVVVLLGLWVGGLLRPYVFNGTVIQSDAKAAPMTSLVYDNGEPVDLEPLRGEVVLIYFGYTHCPDLCPTMLSTVDASLDGLGDRADRVHTFMVTVDPTRDDQEYVGDYVRFFDDRFRGVWGSEQDVRLVATKYGVHFEYDEPDEDGNYLVAHTASLMAIDTDGVLRVVYPVGVTEEQLTSDLRELLR